MKTIGDVLREARTAKGWTQVQLAEASGVPLKTLQNYEADHREPNIRTSFLLADALGIDARELARTTVAVKKPKRPRGRPRKSSKPH